MNIYLFVCVLVYTHIHTHTCVHTHAYIYINPLKKCSSRCSSRCFLQVFLQVHFCSCVCASAGERPETEVKGVWDIRPPVLAAGGEERWNDAEDQRWAGGKAKLHSGSEEEVQRAPGQHRQAAGSRHPDHGWVRDGCVPSGDRTTSLTSWTSTLI